MLCRAHRFRNRGAVRSLCGSSSMLFALIFLNAATLQGASWESTVTIGGINRKVFVPDTSRPVKAVLISNFNDPALQGRPDVIYPSPDLRALGEKWNMMQMHWNGRPETEAARRAEYDAIIQTLNQVSATLGKPEIQYTGIFIQGLSGTGWIASQIAHYAPGRFGGVIQHHYPDGEPPSGVPCLYVVAGLDGFASEYPSLTLLGQRNLVSARVAAGEPGTVYLEPGNWHDTADRFNQKFTALWLDAIIAERFPAAIPTTSMIVLPSWKNHNSWVGCFDKSTDINQPWNRGEKAVNNFIQAFPYTGGRPYIWLPNQRVADAWKTIMDTGDLTTGVPPLYGTAVALTAPVAGTLYDAGANVTATATASALTGSIIKVEFFDNGTLIGTDANSVGGWSVTWTIGNSASHTLVAKAFNSNGEVVNSAPLVIWVPRQGDSVGPTVPGVNYQYYESTGINGAIPDFTGLAPIRSGWTTNFDITAGGTRADNFAYRFTGYVQINAGGVYTFYTTSDDGSKLYIGTEQIVDNDGSHAAQERSGSRALAIGKHAVTVVFSQGTGNKILNVSWAGPGIAKQALPNGLLVRVDNTVSPPPSAPSGLIAVGVTASRISLTWNHTGNTENGFRIERSTNGTTFTPLATIGENITSYYNDDLAAATTYYYRVCAFNASGSSAFAGPASATTMSGGGGGGLPPGGLKINFQLAGASLPSGYLEDNGAVFGNRGNGYSYGWISNNSSAARDRNSNASPDQRYDTLVHMQKPENPNAVWEISVPNGNYSVRVVSGDPSYIDSVYKLNVEGILTVNGIPSATQHWFEGTSIVNIADGRITLSNSAGAMNNKICFVDISDAGALSLEARELVVEEMTADQHIFQSAHAQLLKTAMNFAKIKSDSVKLKARLESVPVELTSGGQTAGVDVAGAVATFTLDKKGNCRNSQGSIRTKRDKSGKLSVTILLVNGGWCDVWSDGGLDKTVVKANLEMPFSITLGGRTYAGIRAVNYNGSKGILGKTR